jgi:hypothetical protein
MRRSINTSAKIQGVFAYNIKVAKSLSVGEELVLVREPNNEHDANAIKVCTKIKSMLWGTKEVKIGYIEKEVAQRAAKYLDAGIKLTAVVEKITAFDSYPNVYIRLKNQ